MYIFSGAEGEREREGEGARKGMERERERKRGKSCIEKQEEAEETKCIAFLRSQLL